MTPTPAERLDALREELLTQMGRLATVDPQSLGIGFGKRIGDGTTVAIDRMESVQVHERYRAKLAEVERAQAKLAEATYGVCDRCGGPIGAERLEHLPSAVRCVDCAGRS